MYLVCNTLQHTATHCNTLQHTATHCNTLRDTYYADTIHIICVHVMCGCLHTISMSCVHVMCGILCMCDILHVMICLTSMNNCHRYIQMSRTVWVLCVTYCMLCVTCVTYCVCMSSGDETSTHNTHTQHKHTYTH